jgi:prolyl oligopeptidase
MKIQTLLALSLAVPALAQTAPPPPTEKRPVTDELHGTKIVDQYRWLEDWNDPKVKAWSESQNAYARSYLDKLPDGEKIRARFGQLLAADGVSYEGIRSAGGRLFAVKHQPPKQQPFLVSLRSADDLGGEGVVVDPNALDKEGGTAMDWFVPSPDGSLVAVSLSKGGSESGDVHIFKADGTATGDVIPRVNGGTAGGSVAWLNGDTILYTRYPRAGDTPSRAAEDMDFYQQVYSHKLGDPATKDVYEIGRDFPRIAEVQLCEAGGWVLASVQKGDGGEFTQHLRKPGGGWVDLAGYDDKIVFGTLAGSGKDAAAYLVSIKGSPKGRLLRLALGQGAPKLADARELVPEQKDAAVHTDFMSQQGVAAADGRVYVMYTVGGPSEVRVFDAAGKSLGRVEGEAVSAVSAVAPLPGGQVLVQTESFITPPRWVRYGADGKVSPTALVVKSPADYSDCEVVREFATSKDGTKVPLSIIRRKGIKLDGSNPTIVWGYGGYGIVEAPSFSPRRRVWLEQGGVYVVANIRGGGEFGEEWHAQGNLTKKQNVFDDFAAAAGRMVELKYCTKEKLAIMGGSNGGLLMGATLTQHPDLCAAVVSSVGIYDMLRVELSSNGAFNVTEFGTVKNPDHFKALYAYSPYHRVADGTKYPPVLFLTGANDPRVDPMQSRKMTARLQAADPKGVFLLRTSANTGHGVGSPLSAQIEQSTDIYSFLMDRLGVKYH